MLRDNESSFVFSNDVISDSQNILITNRIAEDFLKNQDLKKSLDMKSLWVLGVGTVMAGPLIGWNWGLGEAGPLGMLVALIIICFYYFIFFMITSKLSVLFPYIGGPFAYVRQGLGSFGAYWTGVLTCLEFIGGTAVILAVFRNYLSMINREYSTLIFLSVFILLIVNMVLFSVRITMIIHYCITCCALGVLIIFSLGTSETVQTTNLLIASPWFSWQGIIKALPFIAVFFLGLETITMTAEEVRFPERSMPYGLHIGFFTAVVISISIWYFSVGSVNWQLLKESEFPLLFTLLQIQSQDKVLLSTFSIMGSVGFIAALQGFINGYSRQVYALSRGGYFPYFFSTLHPTRKTFYFAILVPGAISLVLSYVVTVKLLIAVAFYSAVFVHLLVIISFIRISKSEPEFFYSYTRVSYSVLLYSTIAILTGILYGLVQNYLLGNVKIIIFALILVNLYYFIWGVKSIRQDAPEEAAAALKMRRNRIRFLK